MDLKTLLRRMELPFVIAIGTIWLLVYLLSRIFIEMSSYDSPLRLLLWIAAGVSPFALYAALRSAFSQKEKWRAIFAYLLAYLVLSTFAVHFIIVQGDLLISSASHQNETRNLKVLGLRKVFKRKLGFDHTSVTLAPYGKPLVLEARPYAYFYLKDKTDLRCTYGTSMLGNTFITSINVPLAEKTQARWIHLEDWVYRYRIMWGFIALIIIVVLIQIKYFPRKADNKTKPWSFWKLLALIMGILFALSLLAYAGLWIYVSYFANRLA